MVFIWGYKGKPEVIGYIIRECPSCKKKCVFSVQEVKRNITVFFMPLGEYARDLYLVCGNCQTTSKVKGKDKRNITEQIMSQDKLYGVETGDTLSQAKGYARQFLAEGKIRNHNLFLITCIELKQHAGDTEALELLRKLNELSKGSYDIHSFTDDAEHMVINCGACFHQYSINKGQGVITSKCPSCGREAKVMT